ncbi:MAG TPA: hypothetical protein VMG60_10405 [Burkholderiaceae bacterium]|nr:hypothetical protein [Burkholderiaceae bacterium]
MIQVSQRPMTPGTVPAGEGAPTAGTEPPAADTSVAAAGAGNADPVAKFKALFGAAPQVQSFYADPNGSGGNGTTRKAGGSQGTKGADQPKVASPPPAAPRVFDIATTSRETIADLRRQGEDRLANTIENAQGSYGDLLAKNPKVKIVVTTSAGNGGNPVLVIRGPEAGKDAHVHTHYHGDNATVADPLGSKAGQNARIRAVILGEDKHAVFVLPECSNSKPEPDSPHNDSHYPADWSQVKDEVKTTQDALAAVNVAEKDVKETTVSFHSGGGMALVNLMRADPSGKLLKADRIDLYDCVYHFRSGDDKHPHIAENYIRDYGKTANGKAVKEIVFYRGTNDVSRAEVIKQSFPQLKIVDMDKVEKDQPLRDADGNFNDSANPIAENANGNWFEVVARNVETGKVAHDFNNFRPGDDAHYRTTGEFLGKRP